MNEAEFFSLSNLIIDYDYLLRNHVSLYIYEKEGYSLGKIG